MITRKQYWVTYGVAPKTHQVEVFADTGIVCDAAPVGRWMIGKTFIEVVAWVNRQPLGHVVPLPLGDTANDAS